MPELWYTPDDQKGINQFYEERFDQERTVLIPLHQAGPGSVQTIEHISRCIATNARDKKKSPDLVHLSVIAGSGMMRMSLADVEKYCSPETVAAMSKLSFQCRKDVTANGVLAGFVRMRKYENTTDPLLAAGHLSNMNLVEPAGATKIMSVGTYDNNANQKLTAGWGHHILPGCQFGQIKSQLSVADATAHAMQAVLRCCTGAVLVRSPERYEGSDVPTIADIAECKQLNVWVTNSLAVKPADKWSATMVKLCDRADEFGEMDGIFHRKPSANGVARNAAVGVDLVGGATSPPAGTPPRTTTPVIAGGGMDDPVVGLDDSVDSFEGSPPHKRASPQCDSPQKHAGGRVVEVAPLGEGEVVREPYTKLLQGSAVKEGVLLIINAPANGVVSEVPWKASAKAEYILVPSYEGGAPQLNMFLSFLDQPVELVVSTAGQTGLSADALHDHVVNQAINYVREQMIPKNGSANSSNSMVHDVTVSIECPKSGNSPYAAVVAVVLSKTDLENASGHAQHHARRHRLSPCPA
jgi:hypothetical protein